MFLYILCFCREAVVQWCSDFSDLLFRKPQKNRFSWSYSLSSIDRNLVQCNYLLIFTCFNKKKFDVSMFITPKNKTVFIWETIWLAWWNISLTGFSLIWKIFLIFVMFLLYSQGGTGPLAKILSFEGEISVTVMNTCP